MSKMVMSSNPAWASLPALGGYVVQNLTTFMVSMTKMRRKSLLPTLNVNCTTTNGVSVVCTLKKGAKSMCCMQRKKNIRDDLYSAFTGAKREKRNTCTLATNHQDPIGISVSMKCSTTVETRKYKYRARPASSSAVKNEIQQLMPCPQKSDD